MSRRTLIILLIVSGGLNLFLAGVIATSIVVHLNRSEAGSGPGPRSAFRLYRAVRELDEPHRSRARALLREKHPEIRARIQAMRAARRDLRSLIGKGTASDDAIEAGFRTLHRARGEAQVALRGLVRQIAGTLALEQRSSFYRKAYRWRARERKWRRTDERLRQE